MKFEQNRMIRTTLIWSFLTDVYVNHFWHIVVANLKELSLSDILLNDAELHIRRLTSFIIPKNYGNLIHVGPNQVEKLQ